MKRYLLFLGFFLLFFFSLSPRCGLRSLFGYPLPQVAQEGCITRWEEGWPILFPSIFPTRRQRQK